MAIITSESTAPGTHPSYASGCTTVECDQCGTVFHADCQIDGRWMLHGSRVGLRDYSGGEQEDLCSACEAELFGEDSD